MAHQRESSQKNALSSARFLDILNYRIRTSPVHAPQGQGMTVQALTSHLTPRPVLEEPTPVDEAMMLSDAMWELNHQIELLNQARSTAMLELDLLKQTMAAQRSSFRRIPPEVLLLIFDWAVMDPDYPFLPSSICRVSRRWYHLVTDSASLWSRITFVLPQPNAPRRLPFLPSFPSARAHLSRSKQTRISVNISFNGQRSRAEDATEALALLAPHMCRCTSLSIHVENFEPIYASLSSLESFESAPLLERLGLTVGMHKADRPEYSLPRLTEPVQLFSGYSPKLKCVHLSGIALPWTTQCTLLTDKDILCMARHVRDDRPNLKQFLDILKASPDLKRLCISRSGPRSDIVIILPEPYPITTLHSLSSVALVDLRTEVVLSFLPYLSLPALVELSMSFSDHRSHVVADCSAVLDVLLRAVGDRLETLELAKTTFNLETLIHFLIEKASGLRELTFYQTNNLSNAFFDRLSPSTDSDTWICPKLSSLVVEECHRVSEEAALELTRRRACANGALERMDIVRCAGVTKRLAGGVQL